MEKLILFLCGFWFWLTRRYRALQYREAAELLLSAHDALASDLYSRWSTRDRGFLLPQQAEALSILKHHSDWTIDTANRFDSLIECCRFVTEELTGMARQPVSQAQPASATHPALVPAAAGATFRFFWNAEASGAAARPFPVLPITLKPVLAEADVPHSRAA
jgi:hypothetical protein